MDLKKQENLLLAYHNFKQLCFYDFPIEKSTDYIDDSIMGYGTHVDEKIVSIASFNELLQMQRDQSVDLAMKMTEMPVYSKALANGDVHLFVEEILFQMKADGNDISLLLRLTTVIEYKSGKWIVAHWHGSTPQGHEGDEDSWHANELKLENEKLERTVVERTNELKVSLEHLKATQTQLIHSEKMASLGELTAGIAHEIQNPLNFVNNFSDLSTELIDEMNEEIDKGSFEEAKAISNDLRENLKKINHHGRRADAIVKGMLEHSRLNSGEKVPTDLNVLAAEFLKLSFHGIRAKDKSFTTDYKFIKDPALPLINVIAQDIGRVILNLINNAFYAVHEKSKTGTPAYQPEVVVSTNYLIDEDHPQVEISIADNGNGIADQIKNKIFQPFFTTKPAGSGTGLGLSLSYDIIKAHGGELKVETIEGNGTLFRILLPAANS